MNSINEHIKRILKTLIYIDEHIDEEMNIQDLAKIACYSPFHFHRIFHSIVGETVHKYVKRLRLEKAASKLLYSKDTITEIALDTNYDTPSAFTKAFKQFMKISPKDYRSQQKTIEILKSTIKELSMIKPVSIEKNLPDLHLLFIRKYGKYDESPSKAWESMRKFIQENHLDASKLRFFGISHDNPEVTSEENLRYDAAIFTLEKVEEKSEIGRQKLQGGKYAVFIHEGAYMGLTETFSRIFLKWFPKSGETFDKDRSVFCEYFHMEYVKSNPDRLITKIYIPLT